MTLAQRLLALLAIALLAGLGAAAVLADRSEPKAVGAAAPGGGWYSALAGSRGPAGDAEQTSCGQVLTSRSLGVAHPVLPCGARILMRYSGETVLTEVIDNQLKNAGRQFELTEALTQRIGLDGTQRVEWRFPG